MPEPEERPFLPYNIHYQIEENDFINNNTPSIIPNNINNSPDEGLGNSSCDSSTSFNPISPVINDKMLEAPVVPLNNFEDFEINSADLTMDSADLLSSSPKSSKKQQLIDLTRIDDDLMSTSLLSTNTTQSDQLSLIDTCPDILSKFTNWNELFYFLKKEIVSKFNYI